MITHRPIKAEKNNYGGRDQQKAAIGKKGDFLCLTFAKKLKVESRGQSQSVKQFRWFVILN